MKQFLFIFFVILSLVTSASANIIDINGDTYATEDVIIVHCNDGEFRDLTNLPPNDISYILSRNTVNPIIVEGKTYINLTTLSNTLISEGRGIYLLPKTKKDTLGKRIGKGIIREFVYNGSDIEMNNKHHHRYYVQSAMNKAETIVDIYRKPYASGWSRIKNTIYNFVY